MSKKVVTYTGRGRYRGFARDKRNLPAVVHFRRGRPTTQDGRVLYENKRHPPLQRKRILYAPGLEACGPHLEHSSGFWLGEEGHWSEGHFVQLLPVAPALHVLGIAIHLHFLGIAIHLHAVDWEKVVAVRAAPKVGGRPTLRVVHAESVSLDESCSSSSRPWTARALLCSQSTRTIGPNLFFFFTRTPGGEYFKWTYFKIT